MTVTCSAAGWERFYPKGKGGRPGSKGVPSCVFPGFSGRDMLHLEVKRAAPLTAHGEVS